MRVPPARPLADLLRPAAGPGVWFAHFTFLYGMEATICMPPVSSASAMVWAGGAATVVALAALVGLAVRELPSYSTARLVPLRTHQAFLRNATLVLTLLATLGVIWTAFPIAILSACSAPAG